SHFQYVVSGAFIIFGGLFSMSNSTALLLSSSPVVRENFETLSFNVITAVGSLSLWNWDLSHVLPINLTVRVLGMAEPYTFHLIDSLSDNQDEFIGLLFLNESFPIWMKLSFLIPAALLMTAGYLLYYTHQMKFLELLKFSAFYSVLMVIVK